MSKEKNLYLNTTTLFSQSYCACTCTCSVIYLAPSGLTTLLSTPQKDDILIVSFTDVGWTPYFPLLGGLVTEMGGLVSHGAVVAREFQLPCVVNVPNATQLLQSGQYSSL